MSLNIKNKDVELLIDEVTVLTGESKKEAVRRALEERRARLRRFLEAEVWPQVPASELGRKLTRQEEESILGFGDHGV